METILFMALGMTISLWLWQRKKSEERIKRLSCQLSSLKFTSESDYTYLKKKFENIEKQNSFQNIAEAQIQAEEIIRNAEEKAYILLQGAETEMNKAKREVKGIQRFGSKKSQNLKGTTKMIMQRASITARSVLQGYEDEYALPEYTFLSGLENESNQIEATRQLKNIREEIKGMIKNRMAATCDYAEKSKKETIIDLIVDSFNGKIYSILNSSKNDSYETLKQKIKNAFTAINSNGLTFKNAKITNEYLEARLEELKWAVIFNKLKFSKSEKYNFLHEGIIEEGKTYREYVKAIRENQVLHKSIKRA